MYRSQRAIKGYESRMFLVGPTDDVSLNRTLTSTSNNERIQNNDTDDTV